MISNKLFFTEFKLDAKMLAIIYICYQYKFPLAFMLSFYEMYGDNSLFALKALSCNKKIKLNDNSLVSILDESKQLYKQILDGISKKIKIKQLINKPSKDEVIPEEPKINTSQFSESYKQFLEEYLLKNIEDIYAPIIKLQFSTEDLYEELLP